MTQATRQRSPYERRERIDGIVGHAWEAAHTLRGTGAGGMCRLFQRSLADRTGIASLEGRPEEAIGQCTEAASDGDGQARCTARCQQRNEARPGNHTEQAEQRDRARRTGWNRAASPERPRRMGAQHPDLGRPGISGSAGDRPKKRERPVTALLAHQVKRREEGSQAAVGEHLPRIALSALPLGRSSTLALPADTAEKTAGHEETDHHS